jgi:hypothetical protein
MAFNMSMTLYIGEYNLLWADIFIVLLPLALLVSVVRARLRCTASASAIEAHMRDFPEAVVPGQA